MRLVIKEWTGLPAALSLTRQEVLDANEWLDAVEDAERRAKEKAERDAKK